jgi:DNA mismatch repair protein PMS2
LDQVTSLGFRGEALNSLCNLAQLSMETATAKTAPKGVELTFDAAGQVTGQRTVPRKMGTTVRARNLFHKIPVRQRDLEKNAKREFTKVVSLLHAYALGQPSIRFSLSNKVGKKCACPVPRIMLTAETEPRRA